MKQLIIISTLCFALSTTQLANAECNQEQAFNKMMALGHANSEMKSEIDTKTRSPEQQQALQTWAQLGREIATVGKSLADNKFTEACAAYDQIAKKYKIDMVAASKAAPKLADLQKQAGQK